MNAQCEGSNGQLILPLFIYGLTCMHKTWNEANQSSCCGVTKSATWTDRWMEGPMERQTQIAEFMGPTWGPPGSCRLQMGPMLAPWTLQSGDRLGLFNSPPSFTSETGDKNITQYEVSISMNVTNTILLQLADPCLHMVSLDNNKAWSYCLCHFTMTVMRQPATLWHNATAGQAGPVASAMLQSICPIRLLAILIFTQSDDNNK